jgi:long-chain acyl-CoA synthetase
LLVPLYQAALRHETPSAPAEQSSDDRVLLNTPEMARIWRWLQQRFANLQLDTIPQIDLAIDSLDWVDLTLALERDLGIVLNRARGRADRHSARFYARSRDRIKVGKSRGAVARHLGSSRLAAVLPSCAPFTLLRLIMRWAFQLRVEGLERLPQREPILFCPNHVSYLDPFALGAALPRERLRHTCWGGWTGVAFTARLRRRFSRAARIIPIDPDRAVMSGLAMGGFTLERGLNLVWFPEGARSADGKLQRFLRGVGALVEKHPVPIVPVYIAGSFSAWPKPLSLA